MFEGKQFGAFCFEFGIFKKELMISQETINNEPKQVKENITIGKTYLFSDETTKESKEHKFIQNPPSSVLLFKGIDLSLEKLI